MTWEEFTANEMKRLDLLLREHEHELRGWEQFFADHQMPRDDPLWWQVRASLDRIRSFQVVMIEVEARVPRFQGSYRRPLL
jgi:hypothetical protein